MMKYTFNPFMHFEPDSSESVCSLTMPYFGLRISGPRARWLNELSGTSSADDLLSKADASLNAFLKDNFIVIPVDSLDFLQYGLLSPAEPAIHRRLRTSQLSKLAPNSLALFGSPLVTNVHANCVVASSGPRFVRDHLRGILPAGDASASLIDFDLELFLDTEDLALFDLGDIVFIPELESASSVGNRTRVLAAMLAERGTRSIAIGGDHSVTLHVVRGLRSKYQKLNIVQLDAHHDTYSAAFQYGSGEIINHANFARYLLDESHVQNVLQIGLRDLYRVPSSLSALDYNGRLQFVSCRRAQRECPASVLRHLDPSVPLYLSIDVDVLAIATPGTTPIPVLGGLQFDPAFDLVAHILSNFSIAGLDIVEIGNDAPCGPADFAARVVMLAAFLLSNTKPMATHAFGRTKAKGAQI